MRILTLCGSLRAQSSNRALLRTYERLAPSAMSFWHFVQLHTLPHFNPDQDRDPAPQEVAILRSMIAESDVVVISTPEYAHALPGSLKNALDWLVSVPSFAGKPVVILHISRGSTWALDSLKEVLRTMSAELIESAFVSINLGSNQVSEDAILARADLCQMLQSSLGHLLAGRQGDKRS
jgi:chromate reductase, NAD(P)H dehydrogenase (quinone)